MSQTELGNRIGVKFQQVQKYEAGTNRVAASRLWDIAEALNVPLVHFFEGIDPSDPNGPDLSGRDYLSNSETVELVELFNRLPAGQQRAVLSFMRSLAAESPAPAPALQRHGT